MRTKTEITQQSDKITSEMLDSTGVPTFEHAIQYLQDVDCNKEFYSRLIPYFLQLELIPKTQKSTKDWANKLLELYQSYSQIKSNFQFDIKNQISEQILSDIKSSFPLFNEYCKILKIDKTKFNEEMFLNIFQIFQKEIINYKYSQGHDLCVWVISTISLSFCQYLNLNSQIAESFIFHLFKGLYEKTKFGIFENNKFLNFQILQFMGKYSGATFSALNSYLIKPETYAYEYINLMFLNHHPLKELLVVWDQILLHINEYNSYVKLLLISHLNQIQIGISAKETLQRINECTEFNINRLISDCNRYFSIYENEKDSDSFSFTYFIAIFVIFVFVFFILLFFKSIKSK